MRSIDDSDDNEYQREVGNDDDYRVDKHKWGNIDNSNENCDDSQIKDDTKIQDLDDDENKLQS